MLVLVLSFLLQLKKGLRKETKQQMLQKVCLHRSDFYLDSQGR